MAVAPITQPTASGISAVDYSPWSQAAQARSALPGILNYTPNANMLPAPTASPTFQGGTQYGNYVRHVLLHSIQECHVGSLLYNPVRALFHY